MMHTIAPYLRRKTVKIAVNRMRRDRKRAGEWVAASPSGDAGPRTSERNRRNGFRWDRITESNCVRQPFSEGEIGLFKSVVLVNRLNLFWGLDWKAVPAHLTTASGIGNDFDLLIGCVDSRAARAAINVCVTSQWSRIAYWLDIGNSADTGQFVLGQPLNHLNKHRALRLRTVAELFEEILDPSLDDDRQPSCSAAEALERQHPFVNQTLANLSLSLLSRLFRSEPVSSHGGFVNLASGSVVALRADSKVWRRIQRRARRNF